MEINDKVLAWVELYSNALRPWFEPSLSRSERYLPMFRQIFADEGLPQDLVYMAARRERLQDQRLLASPGPRHLPVHRSHRAALRT